jgi:hypothetical protein
VEIVLAADMQDVIWSKDKYIVSSETDVMSFGRADVFNLYDALLCLTDSRYRDEQLRAALALPDMSM